MTWARIDEAFPLHRKTRRVGPLGVALAVSGLCYCARFLTDGLIPKDDLESVWPWTGIPLTKIASSLVSAGIWIDVGQHYEVHDYLTYNPSRAEVEADRLRKSEAGRRGGLAKSRAQSKGVPSTCQDSASGASNSSSGALPEEPRYPDPTRPIPLEEDRVVDLFGEPGPEPSQAADVRAVWDAWLVAHVAESARSRTKLNGVRRSKILARLSEGYTADRLIAAIRGALHSPWNMGKNPDGKQYRDLVTLLRDGAQVERLEACASAAGQPHGGAGVQRKTRTVSGVEYDDTARGPDGLTDAERAENERIRRAL